MTENESERITRKTIYNRSFQEAFRKLQVEFIKKGFQETQLLINISQKNNKELKKDKPNN